MALRPLTPLQAVSTSETAPGRPAPALLLPPPRWLVFSPCHSCTCDTKQQLAYEVWSCSAHSVPSPDTTSATVCVVCLSQ